MTHVPSAFPDRDEVAGRPAPRPSARARRDRRLERRSARLAGRVMARRDMGKLVFLDLVDRSGRIQLICPTERTGELDLHLGDVVGVTGSPAKSRRGEPSLQVDELEVLARIRAPLPDTFHGLDRRRAALPQALPRPADERGVARRLRSCARGWSPRSAPTSTARASSRSRRRSCSRATAAASPSRSSTHSELLDADLYLRIADELYLKRLIVGGLEKVYELVKDFRNESVLVQALPRVHAGRVVRGVRRLQGHGGAPEGARPARRGGTIGGTKTTLPRPRRRPLRSGRGCGSSRRSRRTASGRATRPSCARS